MSHKTPEPEKRKPVKSSQAGQRASAGKQPASTGRSGTAKRPANGPRPGPKASAVIRSGGGTGTAPAKIPLPSGRKISAGGSAESAQIRSKQKQVREEIPGRTVRHAGTPAKYSKITPVGRAEHMRATQRKRMIYSALTLAVVVLLFMAVAATAVLYISDYVAAKPNYTFVSSGTIEHSIGTTALIIRDEQTFQAGAEGNLVTLALEGSRVSKGQELAMIIPDGLENTVSSLNNVQQQIVELQRQLMNAGKGSGAEQIFTEADNEMLPIVNMIRTDSITDNMSNLMSYSSSLQVLMDSRDSAMQAVDFQDEQLSSLILEKETLENTLAAQAVTINSEIPGIVSFKLDGLEGELNSESMATITPEQYQSYVEQSKGSISTDLSIKQGEAALRICQNAEQYLMTIVSGCSVTDFPADASVDIRVPSEGVMIDDCKIVRSVQSTGGVLIIMQTSSQVERLLDLRTVDIEIIQKQTSGLRVPAAALVNTDYAGGYAEIFYNSSGYARKLTVQVLDHDREYAVIAPVEGFDLPNLSTIIITNPNTIKEGDKVEQ